MTPWNNRVKGQKSTNLNVINYYTFCNGRQDTTVGTDVMSNKKKAFVLTEDQWFVTGKSVKKNASGQTCPK